MCGAAPTDTGDCLCCYLWERHCADDCDTHMRIIASDLPLFVYPVRLGGATYLYGTAIDAYDIYIIVLFVTNISLIVVTLILLFIKF